MESNIGRSNAIELGMLNWWEDGLRWQSKPLAARLLGSPTDYVTNLRTQPFPGNYVRVYLDGDRVRFNYWGKPAGRFSAFPYGVPVEPWT